MFHLAMIGGCVNTLFNSIESASPSPGNKQKKWLKNQNLGNFESGSFQSHRK
jgi:hypothetical protein